MNAQRWGHQVVVVKPQLFGKHREAIQAELDRMGNQGWELVAVVQGRQFDSTKLFFKRPL